MNEIITITGVSGSGKSLLEDELSSRGYNKIVSVTTRAKRKGEVDGVDYYFLTNDEFDAILDRDGMAEYVEFNGKSYGITKEELNNKLSIGNVVVVVEPHGLEQLQNIYGDTVYSTFIFCDRLTAFNRMFFKRGDSMKDSLSRLKNDYDTIYKSPATSNYNLIVDSTKGDIKTIADQIEAKEYKYKEVYDLITD